MVVLRRRGDAAYVIAVVSGAHFVSHIFLLAFPPLFPLLAREFGLSTARLGLLITAMYVPTLLFQLPVGDLIDRIGARRVLASGIAVTALGIALAGLAPNYPVLLACAFLSGMGQTVFHPADYALLSTVTEASTEGTAFSIHTFGGYAGFAAAPVVVGGVALAIGWEIALIAVGLIGAGYAVVVHLTVEAVHTRTIRARRPDEPGSSPDASESVRETIGALLTFARRSKMLLVFSFYLVTMMAFVGFQSFTTVLAVETYGFDESTANSLLTAHLTATAIGVLVGGPLADRLPVREILVAMLLSAALSVWALVITGVSSLLLAGALLSIVGLLLGVSLPSRDKFANVVADRGAAGKSFGFFFTGLSLGAVVSPVFLGAVIDRSSPSVAFLFVGGFLIVAVVVVVAAHVTGIGHPVQESTRNDD
ncbi:putative sialic acid transporter [Halalkalicoccus paucihalophilus]|uniref:Putative sialic acid transporter n=1 Tax=Halalkalicoccus paucihalophilus TaxID=1008153 RepID=A0A151A8L6_9EURY|nr:MFS transporter [Halalkalicoccus paucihalophilus]KYH23953.1 putative sialic acid transporter [Halalkalicoccus paucihalophilus]